MTRSCGGIYRFKGFSVPFALRERDPVPSAKPLCEARGSLAFALLAGRRRTPAAPLNRSAKFREVFREMKIRPEAAGYGPPIPEVSVQLWIGLAVGRPPLGPRGERARSGEMHRAAVNPASRNSNNSQTRQAFTSCGTLLVALTLFLRGRI